MVQTHTRAFVSWSGGKDSALACYRAMQVERLNVVNLFNMLSEDGVHSRSHHLSLALLRSQAEAMGIPLVHGRATWQDYEDEFKRTLTRFKKEGLQAGIFGDIDIAEHRQWVERVCQECEIDAVLPLWQRPRQAIVEEFIAAGFKAVIVATNADKIGSEWLGRPFDIDFIHDIKRLPGVDLCGENGEYHTFVVDGPIFTKPIKYSIGTKTSCRRLLVFGINARVGLSFETEKMRLISLDDTVTLL
jgi:diphthine-ammonia ligase